MPSKSAILLTSFAHHGSQQFRDDRTSFSHLALFAVREVGDHTNDALGTRGLTGIHHDQELHDGGIHIPGTEAENLTAWCYYFLGLGM
jgi:hypothetical protein